MSKLLAEWFWTDRWMGSAGWLLPLAPRGLYREMLTQAWPRGASLPDDHAAIRAICNVSESDWAAVWPAVEPFWKAVDGRLVNETQLEVYADSTGRKESKVRGGKARAAAAERSGGRFTPAQPPAETPAHGPAGGRKIAPADDQPPSPSPSPTAIPVQPPPSPSVDSQAETAPRSDADADRSKLREALQDLRRRQHAFAEKTDQQILDCAVFHAPTGPVRIDTCANVMLLRATTGKVRGYGQAKPRKFKAAKDGSDWVVAEADEAREVEAWIRAKWGNRGTTAPTTIDELREDIAALKPPLHLIQPIEAALLPRYPSADADLAARVERMRAPAETRLRATA